MQHSLQVALARPHKVALESRSVRVAKRDHVAIVGPDVVEDRLDIASCWVKHDANLHEHLIENTASNGRLHDIGAVQAVDAADVSLD